MPKRCHDAKDARGWYGAAPSDMQILAKYLAVLRKAEGTMQPKNFNRLILVIGFAVLAAVVMGINRGNADRDHRPAARRTVAIASAPAPAIFSPVAKEAPAPSSESLQQILPGVTVAVSDWRAFQPETIIVALQRDLTMEFKVAQIKTTSGGTTWIGKNAMTGASLVGVGTAERWDAVLSYPGGEFEVHVGHGEAKLVDKTSFITCATVDTATTVTTPAGGSFAYDQTPPAPAPTTIRPASASSQDPVTITLSVVPAGAGTVSGGGTYAYGAPFTITYAANPGWVFTGWSGDYVSDQNRVPLLAYLNGSITANFVQIAPATAHTAASTIYTVDAVFFYSGDAEQAAIPIAGSLADVDAYMNSTYHAYVDSNNLVLERSNVPNFRWNFLGAFRVPDYAPSVIGTSAAGAPIYDIYYDSLQFHDITTVVGKFVADKISALSADQAVLIVGAGRNYGGVGDKPGHQSVVGFSGTHLTVAHEMGHNFGLSHDRATDNIPDNDFSYAHGYAFTYQTSVGPVLYGDLMSYSSILPYYSNPDISLAAHEFASNQGNYADNTLVPLGVPVGQPKAADGARWLREGAAAMAAYNAPAGLKFPTVTQSPVSTSVPSGASLHLAVNATGTTLAYQWFKNGGIISNASGAALDLTRLLSADTGLYDLVIANSLASVTSKAAIVGVATNAKVIDGGVIAGLNIVHPNGSIYDQLLLTGAAASFTADPGKVTRISFVDPRDDIVQVEFSGAGTVSLALDGATAPAIAVNYNQPGVLYVKGRAGIVITGANETTNISVFTVGRKTAFNMSLFKDGVSYRGVADIAYLAITTTNGKFGGVRAADTAFSASQGLTGVYAPGVQFIGPVYIGNIAAMGDAAPVINLGSSGSVLIAGGDLWQPNSQPVQVEGIGQITLGAGTDSNGNVLPAKSNRALLTQNGIDVTAQLTTSR